MNIWKRGPIIINKKAYIINIVKKYKIRYNIKVVRVKNMLDELDILINFVMKQYKYLYLKWEEENKRGGESLW